MTVDAATQDHTSNGEAAANDAEGTPQSTDGTQPETAGTQSTGEATAGSGAATDRGEGTEGGEAGEKPKQRKPRKQSTAKKTRSVELTLTITGTADGEWQADLVSGTKRVVRGLNIPAAAVSRAAKELHDDISGAIEQVLDAAREQHRSRVEELQAELEKAQAALAELQD